MFSNQPEPYTMKSKFLYSSLILGAFVFQACQNTNRTSNDPDSLTTAMVDSAQVDQSDTSGINENDTASFMHKAAIGGMMEVELGRLAQQQAENSAVKEFGAMMVKDHTKANTELKAIATEKRVTLPNSYPADIKQHMDEMSKMTPKDFDKHYMKMMVEDHAKDINLFKMAAKDNDATISAFATKTLPVLEGHQKRAKEINSTLK